MDEDDLKRFKEYVERTRHERSGSKEIAFQYLYEHGYIDANGDLTPRYSGPTKRSDDQKRQVAEVSRLLNSISRMASFIGLKFTPDEAKIQAFLTARRMRKSDQ